MAWYVGKELWAPPTVPPEWYGGQSAEDGEERRIIKEELALLSGEAVEGYWELIDQGEYESAQAYLKEKSRVYKSFWSDTPR